MTSTIKQFQIGLKLWSTDSGIMPEAINLYEKGYFDYIELYIVPGLRTADLDKWATFPGEYIIHCPHSGHGFNLAVPACRNENYHRYRKGIIF